jgi:hypothetical protein
MPTRANPGGGSHRPAVTILSTSRWKIVLHWDEVVAAVEVSGLIVKCVEHDQSATVDLSSADHPADGIDQQVREQSLASQVLVMCEAGQQVAGDEEN